MDLTAQKLIDNSDKTALTTVYMRTDLITLRGDSFFQFCKNLHQCIYLQNCSFYCRAALSKSKFKLLLQAIRLGSSRRLRTLILSHNRIGKDGVGVLVEFLKTNTSLRSLDLSYNKITDAEVVELAQAIKKNRSIESLNLNANMITGAGLGVLLEALHGNTTLKSLYLNYNKIGAAGAKLLADFLKTNSTLSTLDLMKNKIDSEGAIFLAQALEVNSSLKKLYLKDNYIGDAGALALSLALKRNNSLIEFDLGYNYFSEEGFAFIAESLKVNNSLKSISLNCRIGDHGMMVLAGALVENKSLVKIELGDNQITDDGAVFLSQALLVNKSLQCIDLVCNDFSAKVVEIIMPALRESNVTELFLDESLASDELEEILENKQRIKLRKTVMVLDGVFAKSNEIGTTLISHILSFVATPKVLALMPEPEILRVQEKRLHLLDKALAGYGPYALVSYQHNLKKRKVDEDESVNILCSSSKKRRLE